MPPLLAVEVAGRDDDEPTLREKAAWYLRNGVMTVWLVLPATRSIVVIAAAGATTVTRGTLPAAAGLDGLEPDVARFFAQLDGRYAGDGGVAYSGRQARVATDGSASRSHCPMHAFFTSLASSTQSVRHCTRHG